MRYFVVALLLSCTLAGAADKVWQDAVVLDLKTVNGGNQTIILPMGTGIYGASVPRNRSFYHLRSGVYTYVLPNYCDGTWSKPWLRLTIGRAAKIAIESSTKMYVIDDDGKERKVSIVGRIQNTDH